ncbi:MAG: sugar-binding protein [Algibacter sp.]|uniref:sugar-binding protein n=1 Tax=Algibacter sp. TaxID=1872428 RepID=UPI003299DAEF
MKTKVYNVNYNKHEHVSLTGKGIDKGWEYANVLKDFISPWDDKKTNKIEFKSLWDSNNLYFLFKVFDENVHLNTKDDSIDSIGNSDRVELFFRSNLNMNPYYCLEIDPTPRLMDFMAYPKRKFDFNWNWPSKDIEIKSDIQKDYFTVEGAISLASLKKFNLLNNNIIEAGIYVAKYNKSKNASFEPTWISWINPQSKEPNFHIASSFGILNLVDY